MTGESLPTPPSLAAPEADRSYYRRRIDELVDRRLHGIEDAIRDLDRRADTLDRRLNWIFGGLAVISVLANLVVPPIVRALTGTTP